MREIHLAVGTCQGRSAHPSISLHAGILWENLSASRGLWAGMSKLSFPSKRNDQATLDKLRENTINNKG